MLINELFESLDKIVPYTWHDRSNEDMRLIHAEFQIGDGLFVVQFKNLYYNPGVWTLSFVRNQQLELSQTGNASTVISTVVDITRNLITVVDPRWVEFEIKHDEPSRFKLYERLYSMLLAEFPQYMREETKRFQRSNVTQYSTKRVT